MLGEQYKIMKRFLFSTLISSVRRLCVYSKPGVVLLALFFCTNAAAQSTATLDEMERHLEEQKIALEQAIAERDATGKKAEEVRDALAEAEAAEQELLAQMEALCEEQAELEGVSAQDCINKLDN